MITKKGLINLRKCFLRLAIRWTRSSQSCVDRHQTVNHSSRLEILINSVPKSRRFVFLDKNQYLRENSKQIIVDVIESLNLVLVFSLLNNTHSLYRITDYISDVIKFLLFSFLLIYFDLFLI